MRDAMRMWEHCRGRRVRPWRLIAQRIGPRFRLLLQNMTAVASFEVRRLFALLAFAAIRIRPADSR